MNTRIDQQKAIEVIEVIDQLPGHVPIARTLYRLKVPDRVRHGLTCKKRLGCWVVLLATLAGCGKDPEQIKKAQSLTRRLAEIAGQANQAAPANVDPDTRLDGARAGPGLKLTSMYTLVNAESNGVNSTTFEAKLAPIVKSASCDNPDLRPLIDQGVVVVLEYRGKQGDPIGTVSINRDTCSALPPRERPN